MCIWRERLAEPVTAMVPDWWGAWEEFGRALVASDFPVAAGRLHRIAGMTDRLQQLHAAWAAENKVWFETDARRWNETYPGGGSLSEIPQPASCAPVPALPERLPPEWLHWAVMNWSGVGPLGAAERAEGSARQRLEQPGRMSPEDCLLMGPVMVLHLLVHTCRQRWSGEVLAAQLRDLEVLGDMGQVGPVALAAGMAVLPAPALIDRFFAAADRLAVRNRVKEALGVLTLGTCLAGHCLGTYQAAEAAYLHQLAEAGRAEWAKRQRMSPAERRAALGLNQPPDPTKVAAAAASASRLRAEVDQERAAANLDPPPGCPERLARAFTTVAHALAYYRTVLWPAWWGDGWGCGGLQPGDQEVAGMNLALDRLRAEFAAAVEAYAPVQYALTQAGGEDVFLESIRWMRHFRTVVGDGPIRLKAGFWASEPGDPLCLQDVHRRALGYRPIPHSNLWPLSYLVETLREQVCRVPRECVAALIPKAHHDERGGNNNPGPDGEKVDPPAKTDTGKLSAGQTERQVCEWVDGQLAAAGYKPSGEGGLDDAPLSLLERFTVDANMQGAGTKRNRTNLSEIFRRIMAVREKKGEMISPRRDRQRTFTLWAGGIDTRSTDPTDEGDRSEVNVYWSHILDLCNVSESDRTVLDRLRDADPGTASAAVAHYKRTQSMDREKLFDMFRAQ